MKNCHCRSKNDNQDLVVRLSRVEGQIKSVKELLKAEDSDCECMYLMNQLRSAISALKSAWEIVAARHLEGCVTNMETQDRNQVIEEIVSNLKELR